MINKCVRAMVIFLMAGFILTSVVAAEEESNSILGIPWGASSTQVRRIMMSNGYSFIRENPDKESGTPTLVFKGPYEGFPNFDFFIRFLNDQMWHIEAGILSQDDNRLNYVFDQLYRQLVQKYGPFSRDESKSGSTKYVWSLNGDAKRITLAKMGTFFFEEEKFDGTVYVTYKNIRLYEAIKKKNI